MSDYLRIPELTTHQPIPDDGILTRVLRNDTVCKIVLFTMSAGQELSEHTASVPATMHFVSGAGAVTLGADAYDYRANAWISMTPGLAHSIRADTPTTMLLIMYKSSANPQRPKGEDA
ncbi:MAG TPA: cupin domain-containing protein [Phycisphaerae bacterium]|nr:cupin domain-containing protein [Phycisphaerae bacterium]HRW55586.1 cupin domain-containing protein [Phycisphaerae bacterium]